MPGILTFGPMGDYPIEEEGNPFIILRHGNDMHSFLIQQVHNFEGGIYPDELNCAVDHTDAVVDAVGWCDVPHMIEPKTIDMIQMESSE